MKSALIIVDVQNDFMPGGALAVADGDQIIPVLNEVLNECSFDLILATKDWHPTDHVSFAVNHHAKVGDKMNMGGGVEQIMWPVHCVQGTPGAEFYKGWDSLRVHKIFYKGTDKNIDSYSTFFDNTMKKSTGLDQYLKSHGIEQIYILGLATDYCVLYSALDALDLGFKVKLIVDGCRGVNLHPHDSEKALKNIQAIGAQLIHSKDIPRKNRSG